MKIFRNISDKVKSIFSKSSSEVDSKITRDTVAEHRAEVLAGGRKYKYPMQYAKRKLVLNAILIGAGAVVVVAILGWWRLYISQDTNEFMYKVTKVIPVPVASIDDQSVLYSDYLMKLRSSIHYLEQKERLDFSTSDGENQLNHIKKQAIEDAIVDAYAQKVAKELGIVVTDDEIDSFIDSQRITDDGEISDKTYNAVIQDYYGWTIDEYRHITRNKLLRQKVIFAVDEAAYNLVNNLINMITSSSDFKTIVIDSNNNFDIDINYDSTDWLPKSNQDGGVTLAASKLGVGEISAIIKSTNETGYYIVRVLEINDDEVKYEYINIPTNKFYDDYNQAKSNSSQYYIDIEQ